MARFSYTRYYDHPVATLCSYLGGFSAITGIGFLLSAIKYWSALMVIIAVVMFGIAAGCIFISVFIGEQPGKRGCYHKAMEAMKEKNYGKAADLFSDGAENGDSRCTYMLAILYESGTGVNKDLKKAYNLYCSAQKAMVKNGSSPDQIKDITARISSCYHQSHMGDTAEKINDMNLTAKDKKAFASAHELLSKQNESLEERERRERAENYKKKIAEYNHKK